MTYHDDRQLRETLERAHSILAKLTESDLDPDRQRVGAALDALCRRGTSTPLTDHERSLLDHAAALAGSAASACP